MKRADVILRELDILTDEVFKLYSVGLYNDAIVQATNVLRTAKEKLGRWHPKLNNYYENLDFVKTERNRFENRQRVNNSNNSSSSKVEKFYALRELNNSIIGYLQMKRYSDANNELKRALSIAIRTFGNNHPYVKILRQNIFVIEKKQYDRINKDYYFTEEEIKTQKSNARNLFVFGTVFFFLTILFLFLSLFTIYKYTLPSYEVDFSNGLLSKLNLFSSTPDSYSYELKDKSMINAPLILQNPELPRGCEVTSLAMLLQYANINVDKMTLAEEVKKDPTPFIYDDGRVHFGNPDYGFVGDMYSLNKPGLGVYHGPINGLAEKYLPGQVIDLTGRPFSDLFYFLNNEIPVWVIINTQFTELSPNEFEVWNTAYGPIQVTYKQHSVLLTGFDEKYVYFNNPLYNKKNQRIPIEQFEKAWNQMGRQAISYVPKDKKLIEILPLD